MKEQKPFICLLAADLHKPHRSLWRFFPPWRTRQRSRENGSNMFSSRYMLSNLNSTSLLSFLYQSTTFLVWDINAWFILGFSVLGFGFISFPSAICRGQIQPQICLHSAISRKWHGLWTAMFYCSGVTKIWIVFLLSLCEDLRKVQISFQEIKWISVVTEVLKVISQGCRNPQVICKRGVARDWQFPGQISNLRWGKKSTLGLLEDWYMQFGCHCNKNSPPTAAHSPQTSQPISWECYKAPPAERARIKALKATSSLPGIVGIHTQSLPHAGDVLLQCRVCYCLQGHAVGFVEIPGIFCQAVTQVILMEFQNTCKEHELWAYFHRERRALPAAVQESGTVFNICHFQHHWGKALCAVSPQSISSPPVFQCGF